MNMNDYGNDRPCCYFHPKEVIVGVCSLCLKERLVILAAKQGHLSQAKGTYNRSRSALHSSRRKTHIQLPKIFALSSLLNRHHKKFDDSHHNNLDYTSTSHEDSFISIKFEENGVASWEKNTVSKVSLEHCNMSWNHSQNKDGKGAKSVIERAKPRSSLRWRKRIGQLFQLIRWKRSNKGNVGHVGTKLEGVKVRNGWIRFLTTRSRTKE